GIVFNSPPAKEGNERSEGVVILLVLHQFIVWLPKNNHPMPSAFPLLRRRGAFISNISFY
ncbi:MAG TPA: hypothetical protein VK625_13675, partial [Flavitalea sp.]|nr:hypothetical protein [Flavitalea sp.]